MTNNELLRCVDYAYDVKVGYKLKKNDELFTIYAISVVGDRFKFHYQSDTTSTHGHMYANETDFVTVYVPEDVVYGTM